MPRPTAEDFNRVDLIVMEDIVEHGWSDIGVFPTKETPGLPFNYSVGLTEVPHPELLVIGLGNEQMHGVLANCYRLIQEGIRFQAGTYSDKVLEGLQVAFVRVLDLRNEDFMMSMATRLYGERVSGLQVVWPDAQGRFPWQRGFDPEFRDRQPLAGPWEEA
jgi:hypothetical protein